ncbi:MAG TPA: FtsX-like permease family protein [Ktedonobacterales bacterium]
MKLGMYWRYATRSLARGGQRTVLAIFCVAVGVLAIVALQLVANMVNASFTTNVRESNGGDISVRTDINPFAQQDLQVFQRLQSDGTITAYTAMSGHSSAQANDAHGHVQYFDLRAIDPAQFPLAGAPDFQTPSGGTLSSVLGSNNVVVTDTLLSQLGYKVGDKIQVVSDDGRTLNVTIAGEISSAGLFRLPQLLISLQDYAAVPSSSGLPVGYNAVYVNVPGHSDANASKAKTLIEQALPQATVTTASDALNQYKDQVQQIRYFLQIVGLLALLIGGVGIINTMQVLLRRRRTEIAMLKTAGYSRLDLFALFALEAFLLGLIGGVIGSGLGVAVSVLMRSLFQRAFLLTLPLTIDPLTVASGVAIGVVTALIFGIMPIVQASQIRPLSVLRELPEGTGVASVVLSVVLLALLAALFFGFSAVILGNIVLALAAVSGTGVFLALLGVFFGVVVLIISRLPVPERFTWWFLLVVAIGIAISVALFFAIPAFGVLFLAISILGLLIVVLPRTWKSNVKMGLRNIGRTKARTVTTLVALFIGVFAIGVILALGQDIQDKVNNVLETQLPYNAFILGGVQNKAQIDASLNSIPGTGNRVVNAISFANPVSVDGVPIATILQEVPKQSGANQIGKEELLAYISGVEGYDLSDPQALKAIQANTIVKGRNITPADAGTNNVVMPNRTELAPLNLHVGSQIVLLAQDRKTPVTATVVGFTSSINFFGAAMYGDNHVALQLASGHAQYLYSMKLNPNDVTQILNQVHHDVPTAQPFNLAEFAVAFTNALNNILLLMTAIASLAMIAGLIVIANAVALAMLERRRELGILKAVGHTSRSVLSEVLLENGIVGFTGGLLAMLLVTLALTVLGDLLFKTDLGVGAPLVLVIVLATAVVTVAVALFVAWRATRVRPLEVLRYE